jgi:hypothetical protein
MVYNLTILRLFNINNINEEKVGIYSLKLRKVYIYIYTTRTYIGGTR